MQTNNTNNNRIHVLAQSLIYEWWYAIAESIVERVCEVTELDEDQREALKQIALRPNDFHVRIEDD